MISSYLKLRRLRALHLCVLDDHHLDGVLTCIVYDVRMFGNFICRKLLYMESPGRFSHDFLNPTNPFSRRARYILIVLHAL